MLGRGDRERGRERKRERGREGMSARMRDRPGWGILSRSNAGHLSRGQGCSRSMNEMLVVRLPLMTADILIHHLTFSHQALLSDLTSRLGRLGFDFTELGTSKDFESASLMLRISIGCQPLNTLNRSGSNKQKVSFLCIVWKQMVQHRDPPGKAPIAKTTSWFNVGAGGEVIFPYLCQQGGSKMGKKVHLPF